MVLCVHIDCVLRHILGNIVWNFFNITHRRIVELWMSECLMRAPNKCTNSAQFPFGTVYMWWEFRQKHISLFCILFGNRVKRCDDGLMAKGRNMPFRAWSDYYYCPTQVGARCIRKRQKYANARRSWLSPKNQHRTLENSRMDDEGSQFGFFDWIGGICGFITCKFWIEISLMSVCVNGKKCFFLRISIQANYIFFIHSRTTLI